MTVLEPTAEQVQQARTVVEFIWEGQAGLFEVVRATIRRSADGDERLVPYRRFLSRERALDELPKSQFFAPVPRTRPSGKKHDVCLRTNILWADIDDLEAPDRIAHALVAKGITPTAVVRSGGKGYWVYIKLEHDIPIEDAEHLNQRLAALLSADRGSWSRARIARSPGTINKSSGNVAYVVEFKAVRTSLEELEHVLPTVAEREIGDNTDSPAPVVVARPLAGKPVFALPDLPTPRLTSGLHDYLRTHHRKGEVDRSKVEQKIFTALVDQGWTDEQILSFADQHALPRHTEEKSRRRTYEWTQHSIAKARQYLKNKPTTRTRRDSMCLTSVHRQPHLNRFRKVLPHVNGQIQKDLEGEITRTHGCSPQTARRALTQLHKAGHVQKVRQGRYVRYFRTPQGERTLASGREYLLPPIRNKLND